MSYSAFLIEVADEMEASGRFNEDDVDEQLVRLEAIARYPARCMETFGEMTFDEMRILVCKHEDGYNYIKRNQRVNTGELCELVEHHINSGFSLDKVSFGLARRGSIKDMDRIHDYVRQQGDMNTMLSYGLEIETEEQLLNFIAKNSNGLSALSKYITPKNRSRCIETFFENHSFSSFPAEMIDASVIELALKKRNNHYDMLNRNPSVLTRSQFKIIFKNGKQKHVGYINEIQDELYRIEKKTRGNFKKEFHHMTLLSQGNGIKNPAIVDLLQSGTIDINILYNIMNDFRLSEYLDD